MDVCLHIRNGRLNVKFDGTLLTDKTCSHTPPESCRRDLQRRLLRTFVALDQSAIGIHSGAASARRLHCWMPPRTATSIGSSLFQRHFECFVWVKTFHEERQDLLPVITNRGGESCLVFPEIGEEHVPSRCFRKRLSPVDAYCLDHFCFKYNTIDLPIESECFFLKFACLSEPHIVRAGCGRSPLDYDTCKIRNAAAQAEGANYIKNPARRTWDDALNLAVVGVCRLSSFN